MVPRALETCTSATTRVRGESSLASSSIRSSPRSSTGATTSFAPVASQTICQGTMLEWCSISVSSTSSPAARRGRAKHQATRLSPSVALRVNTTSDGSGAPRKRATRSRAAS